MKNILFISALLLLLSISQSISAQEDVSKILKNTDIKALERISTEATTAYNALLKIASQKGWATENLAGIDKVGNPIYVTPDNIDAGNLTQANSLRSSLSLQGTGFNIGLWEATQNGGSTPLLAHEAFETTNGASSRIVFWQSGTASSHATHVAGTLIGNGVDEADATGMATNATIRSYSSDNNIAEITTEAANGMLISNHSYGTRAGYRFESSGRYTWYGGGAPFAANQTSAFFGQYDNTASQLDDIVQAAPFHLIVKSAGNTRNANPSSGDQIRNGTNGAWVAYDPSLHPIPNNAAVSCIPTYANAKNILTVGAYDKDLELSSFSSVGFTDDGRMKPDVAGIGVSIYSAENGGGSDYSYKNGTSMATPNVAGSLLLLQERYEDLYGSGRFMTAAMLKAVTFHTAQDLDIYGPDHRSGWGLPQVSDAAVVVERAAWHFPTNDHIMIEDSITATNQTHTYRIHVQNSTDVKATLVWHERPGDPTDAVNLKELRNDLDLQIKQVNNGAVFETQLVNGEGIRGDDDVNNAERNIVASVAPGVYEIIVKHDGSSTGSLYLNESQPFSLVISGANAACKYNLYQLAQEVFIDPNNNMAYYAAENRITSQVHVNTGEQLTYNSGGETILLPGFHAKNGSKLRTQTTGCTF